MTTNPNENSENRTPSNVSRRTIVKGAAWSLPVIASAVAVPMAAASTTEPEREFTITSNFGLGWYPTGSQNQTRNGFIQFDTAYQDKYFYVQGTRPGDVITGVTVTVRISTEYPSLVWSSVPGSNPQWTLPVDTNTFETIDGVQYRLYTTTFTGQVTATDSTTQIPIGFYFRATTPRLDGKARTTRYVTVNGQQVQYTGPVNNIVNTNSLNPPTP